jgi:hypothetical protein
MWTSLVGPPAIPLPPREASDAGSGAFRMFGETRPAISPRGPVVTALGHRSVLNPITAPAVSCARSASAETRMCRRGSVVVAQIGPGYSS